MRKIIARGLILIGVLLICGAAGLAVYNLWDGQRAAKASEEILEQMEDEMEKMKEAEVSGSDKGMTSVAAAAEPGPFDGTHLYELYPDREMPTITINGYRYIGTLEIPKLNLRLPVMEEWDYTRLRISPCRYSGSIYQRNLVIAGHNYGRHFSQVKYLDEGAEIIFTDAEGNEFPCTIVSKEVIEPTNVEEMIGSAEEKAESWDMTLFTCTTGGSARCAVRCVVDDEY